MFTLVNDRIEILAHFQNGSLKPLRFLWKNQGFKVDRVTATCAVKNQAVSNIVFSVESQGNIYELTYNPKDLNWTLTSIFIEGA